MKTKNISGALLLCSGLGRALSAIAAEFAVVKVAENLIELIEVMVETLVVLIDVLLVEVVGIELVSSCCHISPHIRPSVHTFDQDKKDRGLTCGE